MSKMINTIIEQHQKISTIIKEWKRVIRDDKNYISNFIV